MVITAKAQVAGLSTEITKRGLPPNGYKVKVKLTAPANEYYNAAKPKTIVLKVRIRK